MGKDKEIKQKILNSLSGEFEVTKVEEDYGDDVIAIICSFIKNGRIGIFKYVLAGRGEGVDYIDNYKAEENEEIYGDIHDWVEENIDYEVIIRHNGEKLL